METFASVLMYAPAVWFWIFLLLGAAKLARPALPYRVRTLALATLGFMAAYAATLTIGQYFVWKSDPFSSAFLSTPLSDLPLPLIGAFPGVFGTPVGYFVYHVWSRFWFPAIVSAIVAWIFAAFLRWLERYNPRFFVDGEVTFGFLAALLAGWPGFVVFVPAAFLLVVLLSIVRGILLREPYTTLGWPMALAAATAWIFANFIFAALGANLRV